MSHTTAPPPSPRITTEVRWSALRDGVYEISLEGPLRLGWLGRFTAALSMRLIAISRVLAERAADGTWTARIVLEPSPATPSLATLDFLALTEEESALGASDPGRPRLLAFRISRSPDDLLELVVTAADEVGFLSALFARLGFLGLFPERIFATTRSGRIEDTLLLRGISDQPPSLATEHALHGTLTRLCAPGGPGSSPPGSNPGTKSPSLFPPPGQGPSTLPPAFRAPSTPSPSSKSTKGAPGGSKSSS